MNPLTHIITDTEIDARLDAEFHQDRYFGDTLKLPYSFEELQVAPNEFVTNDVLNNSLDRLYTNFLYLNDTTKVAKNDFPTNYIGAVGGSVYNRGPEIPLNSIGNSVFGNIVDGAFAINPLNSSYYTGFVINNTSLVVFSANKANNVAVLRSNSNNAEEGSSFSFRNLTAIAINTNNELFISDSQDNLVYKFDVSAYVSQNPAVSGLGRFLTKIIGGTGTINDKDRFNVPVSIKVGDDNKVYVLDQGNKCYKVFDYNLNWLSTIKLQNIFKLKKVPVDLEIDVVTKEVYVLSSDGSIFIYNEIGSLIRTITLTDTITTNEVYKKITFSNVDDNIVYIMTNFNVIKKFKSRIDRLIGTYDIEGRSSTISKFVTMLKGETSSEFVFWGVNVNQNDDGNNSQSLVMVLNEETQFRTCIYDNYKYNCFTLDSILLKNEEYVSDWVINKALYKLNYNHILLLRNIHSKFVCYYDEYGTIRFNDNQYILETETNGYNLVPDLNSYVGINEGVMRGTINRTLEQIYNLQTTILIMIQERITNVYPLVNREVTLP